MRRALAAATALALLVAAWAWWRRPAGPAAATTRVELAPAAGAPAFARALEPRAFELPKLPPGKSWRRFLDTSLPPGEDALEPGSEAPVALGRYGAGPRSVVVLVGR